MRPLISGVRAVLSAGVVLALIALIVLLALPRVSPLEVLIVRGGSMEPTIHQGSAVVVDRNDRAPLAGAVITFHDPQEGIVTHRVVRVDGSSFETQGDANANEDVTRRSSSDVIGTVRFSIPLLGYAIYLAQQPSVFFFVLISTLGMLILGPVRAIRDEVRMIRGRRDAVARADQTGRSPDA